MKKPSFYHTIICLLYSFFLFAQAPTIEWQKRYGGSGWQVSYGLLLKENNYMIEGRSNSNISGDKSQNSRGGLDYWIVTTDSNGNKLWDKTIGGGILPNGVEQDYFTCSSYTENGGHILCGYSNAPLSGEKNENAIDFSNDIWIVKLNNLNQIEWQNVIGGTLDDRVYSITNTSDGGCLVGGISNSSISGDKTENCRGTNNNYDFWIIKLNNIGEIIWQRTIGGDNSDVLNSVIQTNDGGFLIGGNSLSNISSEKTENSRGGNDFWIIKLDTFGNTVWQKTIGGSGEDNLSKLVQTNDGGFLFVGYSTSTISGEKSSINQGGNDYWIIKANNIGEIEWQRDFGGNLDDTLFSAIQCLDGGFLLTGTSKSGISGDKTDICYGGYDSWIVKINSIGSVNWQKTIGGSGDDGFNQVIMTSNNGYLLSGGTNSPVSGNIINNPKGTFDFWLIKLSPENLSNNEISIKESLQIYPNPTTGIVNFSKNILLDSVEIFDDLGRSVKQFSKIENSTLDLKELSNGVYFCIIHSNGEKITQKIIVEK